MAGRACAPLLVACIVGMLCTTTAQVELVQPAAATEGPAVSAGHAAAATAPTVAVAAEVSAASLPGPAAPVTTAAGGAPTDAIATLTAVTAAPVLPAPAVPAAVHPAQVQAMPRIRPKPATATEAAGTSAAATAAAAAAAPAAVPVEPEVIPGPAVKTGAAPEVAAATAASITPTNTRPVIPYNMQCGGLGSTAVGGLPGCGTAGRECRDTPWSGVVCTAGTICVRSNEWWWFCNYGTPVTVPAYAQCGGKSTTPYNGLPGCGGAGRECVDYPWSGVRCAAGTTCVRSNEWWWGCMPTTDPCAGRTCSGRGTCSNGVCTCQSGWTGANCETAVTPTVCRRTGLPAAPANSAWPSTGCDNVAAGGVCRASCAAGLTGTPQTTCGSNGVWQAVSGSCTSAPTTGCPAGWERAVGTLYDSWPKPGTKECIDYSGCKWAGLFSRLSAGPLFSSQPVCNANLCASYRDPSGVTHRAQCLAGDQRSFEVACRWPETSVRSWRMAATWDQDAALLNTRLQVMVEGRPQATTTVNVMDVCNDNDCNGCCRQNTGNGAYKLIDIEKWPALDLLGNFDPNSSSFDINNVQKPAAGTSRPGAPSFVMPLCYRRV